MGPEPWPHFWSLLPCPPLRPGGGRREALREKKGVWGMLWEPLHGLHPGFRL